MTRVGGGQLFLARRAAMKTGHNDIKGSETPASNQSVSGYKLLGIFLPVNHLPTIANDRGLPSTINRVTIHRTIDASR